MVVLVTGAEGGIGSAVVRKLRQRGERVFATDAVPRSEGCEPLDVRDRAQWDATVASCLERWGRIDVLMNIAGVAQAGHFADLGPESIDWHYDVNIKGAAHGMQAVLPTMLAQASGHLVNVASLAATAPVPGIALYSSSKFALRGLSLALATELKHTGVAVSLVHPDLVDTPMIAEQKHQPEAAYSFSGDRMLTADEVAEAIVGPVLTRRPLELFLPRSRGVLSRAVGAFPGLGHALAPLLRRRGLARQRAARESQ